MTRTTLLASTALAMSTSFAFAAGIERNAPSSRVLFEEGRYLEFSFSSVDPDLEGTGGLLDPLSQGTGDLFESYFTLGAAYKADINDRLSFAVIFDEPVGVDTLYPNVVTSGYSGTAAELNGRQLSFLLGYDVSDNVKVYGGLRAQTIEANAFFPFFGALTGGALPPTTTYDVQASEDWGLGYAVGAAYSIPEIALRVALTYYSKIEHELSTVETITGLGVINDIVDIETPQSINLEFQSGIAENTLLFGSVRWVDWSEFAISPTAFTGTLGQPLVDYEEDWVTYTLGVGRRFSDEWSGSVQVSHEPQSDTTLTTLGPVDGRTSIGLGASYTASENVTISGGLTYVMLGDARNFANTDFDDGDALGFGLRIGYSF
ncbi:MAG: outer membrane protein transport protein [Pseudomonadota bacterium]